MDRGAVLYCAALFIILAALTSIASSKVGEPDRNGAVASALRHHLADFVGVGAIEAKEASIAGVMPQCSIASFG